MRGWTATGALFAVVALGACAQPPDPGAAREVPLRDVLLATPEQVRSLPIGERLRLAERLEDAMLEQRADDVVDETETVPAALEGDVPREARGDDAIVALAAELAPARTELRTLAIDPPDAGTELRPRVELTYEDEELERLVLGRADEWIQRMARDRGARSVVRMHAVPAGLLGDAETIFVNPVWLELLALLDEHELGTSSSALIGDPLEHHREASMGWGCYRSMGCDCSWDLFGSSGCSCSCGTCGFDCGACAWECGDDDDGLHCATAGARPPSGSPIDPLWVVAPALYLAWRRKRG